MSPTREMAEILDDFIEEHGENPGWGVWLTFLRARHNIASYWQTVGLISSRTFASSLYGLVK